jgi:hypothetical protein
MLLTKLISSREVREKRNVPMSFIFALFLLTSYSYYVLLRIQHNLRILEPRVSFGDTPDYFFIASQSLFSSSFWIASKPPVTPLFFKLLESNPDRIMAVQLWLSILAWGFLAFMVAFVVRSRLLKPLAFLMILGFSLDQNIIMWDSLILSDSLALSLLALFLSFSLWLLMEWKWYKVILLASAAVLLAFVRDTYAYWLLLIAICLLVLLFFTHQRKRVLLVSGIFISLFLASNALASAGYHWYTPFLMTVGLRILPNPEYVTYFEGRGMPVNDTLMERSGKPMQADDAAMLYDPRLDEFRRWVKNHGRREYVRFLWFYKAEALQAPLKDLDIMFNPYLYPYTGTGYRPILTNARLNEILYPSRFGVFTFFLANLFAAALIIPVFQYRQMLCIVPLVLILSSYPQAVLIWNADANDIARHSLYHNVELRLGLWLLVFFVMDFLLINFKLKYGARASTAPR